MPAQLAPQDLAYMRTAVIRAHVAASPRRMIESTARYTDDRFNDRVRLRDMTDNQRQAQRERELRRVTTRVKATETRPKKGSTMPLPPWAFDNARLVQAIGRLPDQYQAWLRYAYADSKAWDDEAGVTRRLWEGFAPVLGKAQAKTLARAKGLCHLAVQDHKARKNRGRSIHEPAKVRELLGVKESNWDQHWCPRWQAMHRLMDTIDREALAALWELTDV